MEKKISTANTVVTGNTMAEDTKWFCFHHHGSTAVLPADDFAY